MPSGRQPLGRLIVAGSSVEAANEPKPDRPSCALAAGTRVIERAMTSPSERVSRRVIASLVLLCAPLVADGPRRIPHEHVRRGVDGAVPWYVRRKGAMGFGSRSHVSWA